jgi:hypothetical protein
MSVVTGQAATGASNKASELKKRFLSLVMIMFSGDVQAMEARTAKLQQGDGGSKRVVKVLASIAIGVVILNQIFQIDSIANSSGPFAGVIDTLETVGSAALVLLVVGLVAYGGAIALSYMDMF